MPQLLKEIDGFPAVIPAARVQKLGNADLDAAIISLKRYGFAFVDTSTNQPSWTVMETLMNRLDPEMIELVNSGFDEKKIIKSSQSDSKHIDK